MPAASIANARASTTRAPCDRVDAEPRPREVGERDARDDLDLDARGAQQLDRALGDVGLPGTAYTTSPCSCAASTTYDAIAAVHRVEIVAARRRAGRAARTSMPSACELVDRGMPRRTHEPHRHPLERGARRRAAPGRRRPGRARPRRRAAPLTRRGATSGDVVVVVVDGSRWSRGVGGFGATTVPLLCSGRASTCRTAGRRHVHRLDARVDRLVDELGCAGPAVCCRAWLATCCASWLRDVVEARVRRRHQDQVVAVLRLHRSDRRVERRRVGGLLERGDERFGVRQPSLPPCCADAGVGRLRASRASANDAPAASWSLICFAVACVGDEDVRRRSLPGRARRERRLCCVVRLARLGLGGCRRTRRERLAGRRRRSRAARNLLVDQLRRATSGKSSSDSSLSRRPARRLRVGGDLQVARLEQRRRPRPAGSAWLSQIAASAASAVRRPASPVTAVLRRADCELARLSTSLRTSLVEVVAPDVDGLCRRRP